MVESRGPGSDAAAVARLLPPTLVTLCCMIIKCSSSQYSIFLFLFVFSRDATLACCAIFPLFCVWRWAPQGVGRRRVGQTKMSILSASTTYLFVLHLVQLFFYLCLVLGATRLVKKKCPFYPPVQRIFSYFLVFTADIRIIFTVNRIIFTVNRIIFTDYCHGAPPWYLCGLLDGVR